jgi:hypothetical protein
LAVDWKQGASSPQWGKPPRVIDNSEVVHAQNYATSMARAVRECAVEGCCEGLAPTTRYANGTEYPARHVCDCKRRWREALRQLRDVAGDEYELRCSNQMFDLSPEKKTGSVDPERMRVLEQQARVAIVGMTFDAPEPDEPLDTDTEEDAPW